MCIIIGEKCVLKPNGIDNNCWEKCSDALLFLGKYNLEPDESKKDIEYKVLKLLID